ncbi:putative tRNA (carboxymethyluridine(34)-5-O)-methyltransferase [Lupinus albus]|uniref:Putative tRNA (Carboxymethyluridine(34)-5-O)-methyltransferase n=1 Tax=Lupinus albus TaxID=3870 RepID=A0A6A4P380_LUPAL|nr:putative tRNA (carboxymethyluridine(34)-5-O)-methyltransferase [Lupinus albus]
MVHHVLKASRFCYQPRETLGLVIAFSSYICHSPFGSIKEISYKVASSLSTLASNRGSCITYSMSVSENPNALSISVKSTPEIEKKGHEVLVADAVNLPYKTGFGDAAISIAVLHHLSTENRRRKAIEELVRIVKKGGLVLITVWAVEQEDKSLLTKWTPLSQKYGEEWIGPGSPRARTPSSLSLESIPESEESSSGEHMKDFNACASMKFQETEDLRDQGQHYSGDLKDNKNIENQQEYFVPWHLPYHRAEVSGSSAQALANGLATRDDKKGAVVYNRYYHVFSEGELERLVSGINSARVVDRFFDKSNWCIILEKVL